MARDFVLKIGRVRIKDSRSAQGKENRFIYLAMLTRCLLGQENVYVDKQNKIYSPKRVLIIIKAITKYDEIFVFIKFLIHLKRKEDKSYFNFTIFQNILIKRFSTLRYVRTFSFYSSQKINCLL